MKVLFSFVATILLVFVSLTINANSQEYVISGQCLESSSHTGISGVDISITSNSTQKNYDGSTNVEGWYSISVPANSSYSVKASLDGNSQTQSTGSSLTSNRTMDPFYFD